MNNSFYIIKPAVGTKETGMAYPAVESYEDYNFNSPNSVYKIDSDYFPNFTPDIRYKLNKRANLCDVLGQGNISACGLLINKNVKEVFEQFHLIPHQYFPAIIEDDGVYHTYYWIHFVWEDALKYLNFEKSKFKIKRASKDLGEIDIKSIIDLHAKQSKLGFIKMIHNYEYTFINPNFDLFIHPLNKTIFVSEVLKNKLNIFSGIELNLDQHLKLI